VDPGLAGRRAGGDAGLADQAVEGAPDVVVAKPGARGGQQQRGADRRREQLVARLEIVPQRRHRGWVQREQAGLAELAVAHPQQPVVVGVEVVAVEPDRLADAHPGDGQQADQGLVGRCPKRAGQGAGGIDERGDIGLGV
jgi:hypothetical protein